MENGVKNMDYRRNIELIPVQIRTAGEIVNLPFHSTPGSKDGDWMLTLFLGNGEGEYRNSKLKLNVTGGMAGLVDCVDPGVLLSDPGKPYHHFYCRFSGIFAQNLAKDIVEKEGCPFFSNHNVVDAADCIRKMGRINQRELKGLFGYEEALLLEALTLIGREEVLSLMEAPLTWPQVESYLHRHLSEPLTLDGTAGHFHMSRSSLCRFVKAETGMTFQQNLERLRMDWAADLLRDTALNIGQTAERTGYGDSLYFSRVFKKRFGVSPREWRNRIG